MTRVAINSSSSLDVTVDHSEKDTLVRLSGRINVDSSPDLRDHLLTILLNKPSPRTVTVDLAGVSYTDLSGIATLIEALKIARHHETEFCMQGLSGSVLRLFQVTSVLDLFHASGCEQKVS